MTCCYVPSCLVSNAGTSRSTSARKSVSWRFSSRPPTDMPTFVLTNPKMERDDWYVMERTKGNDTITLWITDSLIYKQDSPANGG